MFDLAVSCLSMVIKDLPNMFLFKAFRQLFPLFKVSLHNGLLVWRLEIHSISG